MRVLAVGDVCGKIGCVAAARILPALRRREQIDLVIINGENSADGNGITPDSAEQLFSCGADVITGGNHTLRRKEIYSLLDENAFLLRPHNLPAEYGKGYCLLDMGRTCAAVLNLSGRIYLEKSEATNPFLAADALLEQARNDGARLIFVDFHAEATSEKRALGIYLDGKITALFGTHTHVQTADAQILPHGTGYITDLGMTGPADSVLGVKPSIIINRLKTGDPAKFELADGRCILNGCIFDVDSSSGKTTAIKPLYIQEETA